MPKKHLPQYPVNLSQWHSQGCLINERKIRLPDYFRKDIDGYLLSLAISIFDKYSTIKLLIDILGMVEYESYFYMDFRGVSDLSKTTAKRSLTELIDSGIVRKINSKGIYQVMPAYVWWGRYDKKEQSIMDWLIKRKN